MFLGTKCAYVYFVQVCFSHTRALYTYTTEHEFAYAHTHAHTMPHTYHTLEMVL